MEETLNRITEIIEEFNSSNNHNPQGLLDMGRNLSSNLFFLEKFRIEAHLNYETVIYSLKNQDWKINAAINEAKIKVPELYMLRRTMESAESVLGMIRTEISWIKTEMNNTNIHG